MHMPLNMTATSCHFGLLSRARRTPDLRMCELHCGLLRLGRINVMISTQASVKALVSRRTLTWSDTGHVPTSDPAGFFTLATVPQCCPERLLDKLAVHLTEHLDSR